MLTLNEVARATKMTNQNLYRLLQTGKFPKHDIPVPNNGGRGSIQRKYGLWSEDLIAKWNAENPIGVSGKRPRAKAVGKSNGVYRNKQVLSAKPATVQAPTIASGSGETVLALRIVQDLFSKEIVFNPAVQARPELVSMVTATDYMLGQLRNLLSK